MIMIKVIWYDDIGDIYDKHRINRLKITIHYMKI